MIKKYINLKIDKFVILTLVVTFITLIVGVVFIFKPFLNKTKMLRTRILYERDKNLLIGKIRALDKHLKVYKKRMPGNKNVPWLLKTLSNMALDEGLEISYIEPGDSERGNLYTKLSVVLEVVSTYHQFGRFISRIESSDKFLKVENVKMVRLDSDKEFGVESAKLKAFDIKANITVGTIIIKK